MPHSRSWILAITGAALTAVSGSLVACGSSANDQRSEYANDGDTGAAAPATQQTLSPNPAMGDSSQGLQGRTGQPGVAGDSGRPTVARPDTTKGQNLPPVPQPGQPRQPRP